MFDANWERIHRERQWGKYPKEELVRWASRNALPGARVLDLGSGQGGSTWFLAREGFTPIALDGSFSGLLKARDRLNVEGLPYQGVLADLAQLPFMSDCFDSVVDIVSSAHNTRSCIRQIFAEVARILKPKGTLFSVTPTNRCSRRTFNGLITSFLEKEEVEGLLEKNFRNIEILRSTYQLDRETTIDCWITACVAKE